MLGLRDRAELAHGGRSRIVCDGHCVDEQVAQQRTGDVAAEQKSRGGPGEATERRLKSTGHAAGTTSAEQADDKDDASHYPEVFLVRVDRHAGDDQHTQERTEDSSQSQYGSDKPRGVAAEGVQDAHDGGSDREDQGHDEAHGNLLLVHLLISPCSGAIDSFCQR